MTDTAGRTVSVRMPAGAIEELKAATGVPFSRLVRWTMMALLERKRRERNTLTPAQQVVAIVAEMPAAVLDGDEGDD